MMTKLKYYEEPLLKFGYNQNTADCHDGLSLFGPYETAKGEIKAGVISTEKGLDKYKFFVNSINAPIYTQSISRPSFPGFYSVFGIEWPSNPFVHICVAEATIQELLLTKNLKERTHKLVSLYIDKILNFNLSDERAVDIWFIVIPKSIYINCRPKSKSGQAKFSRERIALYKMGQLSIFDDEDEVMSEYIEMYESDSDFHDQLKARLIKHNISVSVQIIIEDTLLFINKSNNKEYKQDMKAYIAWTQSSTVYYKLGYLPWKLASVREGVCYIGLSYKRIQDKLSMRGYACCAAQMFLDSGDGVVFRGSNGPWYNENYRSFHLNKSAACDLIRMAINSYQERMNCLPRELFIHAKSAFSDQEWEGFISATNDNKSIKLVGVSINERDGFKIYNDTPSKPSNYGNLRGMAYIVDERSGYLWTRGFIPKIQTANHLEVSNPLRITITRGNADIDVVMKDILNLTKLNYNACIYGDGLPVTIKFSNKVGNILTAINEVKMPAKQFKYYI